MRCLGTGGAVKGAVERERKGCGEKSLGHPLLREGKKVYRDTTLFLLFLLQPSLTTRNRPSLSFPYAQIILSLILANPPFLILKLISSFPSPTPQISPPHPSPIKSLSKAPSTPPRHTFPDP